MLATPETQTRRLEMPLLAFDQVSVAFGDRLVLHDINTSIRRGQAILVVGPSGSGKSTWAMLAAGLIPEPVEAKVQGTIWRHPDLERPGAIGYVFQDPESQFCQIRVGEEVAFGLENRRMDPDRMAEKIQNALHEVGLASAVDREHHTLSGGNKQKLALAAALALDPEMLILDEPTANLDGAATAAIFDQIEGLIQKGRTVVVIEHKFQDLVHRIPWVLLLNRDGSIHRMGPTQQTLAEEQDWLSREGLVDEAPAQRRRAAVPSSNNSLVVTLRGVSAQYHRWAPVALDGVTLAVRPGELVALVGPNGAGKSTLLKAMAGLLKVRTGDIQRPTAEEAGFGFQNPEHQFIFERVADELANHYIGGAIPEEVARLLQEFELAGHEWDSPYSLSQGQKRRLSVAVMVHRERRLYCLDEPTFGQDARTRRIIMERLQNRREAGAAVVISSHDLDLVRQYATRVIALEGGRVIFDGTPETLFKEPSIMCRARLVAGDFSGEDNRDPGHPPVFSSWTPRSRQSLLGRLNPAWKLLTVFVAVGLSAAANRLGTTIPLAALPILLLVGFSGVGIRATLRRVLPFAVFFAVYVWMMTAYAAVGPHTPVVHVLWYRLSYPGFMKGLVLGTRMLAAVSFGILFVSTVDLVDLVKSLSRQFRVPPKFSYGTLAGLSFFPRFRDEWNKLVLARRVRGKETRRSWTRIVTYALPILSDAVRLSERVAIAMEARGFRGPTTASANARTYYRASPSGWRDIVFFVAVVGLTVVALWH